MNSKQHSFTHFTPNISGKCPWKNPEGKTIQGEILLFSLHEIFMSLQQQSFQH
jgi:hypothetical protein